MACGTLPKCVTSPIKLAHEMPYMPALQKLNPKGVIVIPSLRKLLFCDRTPFLKSTQTALESSQSEIFQKWPKYVLRSLM